MQHGTANAKNLRFSTLNLALRPKDVGRFNLFVSFDIKYKSTSFPFIVKSDIAHSAVFVLNPHTNFHIQNTPVFFE